MAGEVWHEQGQSSGTEFFAFYCADAEWMHTDERPWIHSGVGFDVLYVLVESVGFLAYGT